jgi:hypothetical protein
LSAALVEILLFFGIALGLAGWELYRVSRELAASRDEAERRAGTDADA